MNPLFGLAAPQLALAGGIVGVMALGFPAKGLRGLYRWVAAAAVVAAGLLAPSSGSAGVLSADGWTRAWHFLFAAGGLMLIAQVDAEDETPFALIVGTVLGMSVLASSHTFVGLFVGLELMSLPAYLLVYSLRRSPATLEAATKYFFMGSAASSAFLLGLAAAFGATGSLELQPLGAGLGALAAALMGSAALFKIGAFPFHFWLPDAYGAAEPRLAGFLSTSMKAAGFLLLLRLLSIATPASALFSLLPAAAALTMTLGNVMAWRQSSATRLLAYSSIAHAGYILIGVVAWSDLGRAPAGAAAIYVYLAAYLFTNFGLFSTLASAGVSNVEDLRGLARRSPRLAAVAAVFLLSLSGMPPTAGFLGKLLIFWDAVSAGRIALVVIGVLNTLVGLGYYIRLIRLMYLEGGDGRESRPAEMSVSPILWICAVVSAISGLLPWAADWARHILVK
jgi:NADH-quinone oxidoreductase subunit N